MIEIPLTRGKVALIDDADAPLAEFSWAAKPDRRGWYAFGKYRDESGKWRGHLLHRRVLGAPPGVFVDHINGNGLDCRRINLRFASLAENHRNRFKSDGGTSRFKGVHLHEGRVWVARIRIAGKQRNLGHFASERAAAEAYDAAARVVQGEFARLNFPYSGEQSAFRSEVDRVLEDA